ncbi:MAG: hypothetical protein ACHQZR_01140, partial [Candidatus Limnocylindrales bacterium]
DDVWMVGPNTARELFYPDASPALAAWATQRLRSQCYGVMSEPSPLAVWPDVPSQYIVCRDDHALDPAWARGAVRDGWASRRSRSRAATRRS